MLPGVQRGILGGTFDPPHLAHLFAGEAAYRELGLDVVTFLPAGAPWQKADSSVSAPVHRLEMTQLATDPAAYFEVDDREVRRDGWTYTIDTLGTFPPQERIVLILGADAARGVPTWHRARDVMDRARFAVLPRPGVDRGEVDAALAGADIVWLDTPEIALSGTMLRARARAGHSLRFLVPDPVWSYVLDHGLYVGS
jgi:nicotinate-nucleotide adenylyltransferase